MSADLLIPGDSDRPKWARLLSTLGPALGLVAVFLLFTFIAPPSFSTSSNIQLIARQTTIVGIAALGMTLVIISGGIDLSVGSTIALTTVVIAWLLDRVSAAPALAALGGIGAGAMVGLIMGILITRLKVVPFIVTLGMMLVIRGVAKGIAGEQKIDAPDTWLTDMLAASPSGHWPSGVWIMIGLTVIMFCVLRYTVLGLHILAVGSNEQTARLCGVRVDRVKVQVYMICGALAGLAGLMQFSRLTVGDPTVAIGKELEVIAAVVIGGGSLSGGEGSIPGTIIGAIIMTVIRNGCSQMGISNWIQEIITGIIIVLAVTLDSFRRRRMK
jgi:ribose transport system permease protein